MKLAEKILENLNNTGRNPLQVISKVRPKIESEAKHSPPKAVQKEAQKALDYRKEHGDDVKGGTQVGWTRAGQLARGEDVSLDIIKRMNSFFARHDGNQKINPENKDRPYRDAGHVAWLLWGGDSGRSWAKSILKDKE